MFATTLGVVSSAAQPRRRANKTYKLRRTLEAVKPAVGRLAYTRPMTRHPSHKKQTRNLGLVRLTDTPGESLDLLHTSTFLNGWVVSTVDDGGLDFSLAVCSSASWPRGKHVRREGEMATVTCMSPCMVMVLVGRPGCHRARPSPHPSRAH